MQLAQLACVEALEYFPTVQFEHEDAFAAEYFPAGQGPVTAERPVVAQYHPSGHNKHVNEAFALLYWPASQLVQGIDPDKEYVPVEHKLELLVHDDNPYAQQIEAPVVMV